MQRKDTDYMLSDVLILVKNMSNTLDTYTEAMSLSFLPTLEERVWNIEKNLNEILMAVKPK